jgi:hypothetical protein
MLGRLGSSKQRAAANARLNDAANQRREFGQKVVKTRTVLERLIADDVPHGDLTTGWIGVGDAPNELAMAARQANRRWPRAIGWWPRPRSASSSAAE